MAFNEMPPEWNESGVEPPQSKKDSGYAPGDKPPAQWMNWFLNRMYKALSELQGKALEKLPFQQVISISADTALTEQDQGLIKVTAASSDVTLTLPVSPAPGLRYSFLKKEGVGTVYIRSGGSGGSDPIRLMFLKSAVWEFAIHEGGGLFTVVSTPDPTGVWQVIDRIVSADGMTLVEGNVDGIIRVRDGGITQTKLASGSVGTPQLISGSATDDVLGSRTITDTTPAASGADTLTGLLSKLGNMIKAITGKSNWYTPPAATIEALSTGKLNASAYTAVDVLAKVQTVDGPGSGLDADTVDGFHAGHASGNVPVSNGTLNADLNADMVDGFHADIDGNGNTLARRGPSGNLAAKQLVSQAGTGVAPLAVTSQVMVQNLNADLLDGQHASYFAPLASPAFTGPASFAGNVAFNNAADFNAAAGTAPFSVASTTAVTNLNADMLDGYHASDFANLKIRSATEFSMPGPGTTVTNAWGASYTTATGGAFELKAYLRVVNPATYTIRLLYKDVASDTVLLDKAVLNTYLTAGSYPIQSTFFYAAAGSLIQLRTSTGPEAPSAGSAFLTLSLAGA